MYHVVCTIDRAAGFGIGLASVGHTATDIQFTDYIFSAFDQIPCERTVKFRYRSGGHFSISVLTVPTPAMAGAVDRVWLCHSQSPQGFFMGASGLKVSIHDSDPVIFMEPKVLYRSAVEQVPIDDFALAFSRAEIIVAGSGLTLLTWAPTSTTANSPPSPQFPTTLTRTTHPSLRSAKVELIDLRTIWSWDVETIVETGVIGGAGREIAVEASVRRITGWDVPAGLQFEKFNMPDAVRALDGIIETLSY
ncbi:uncharacterized protein BJ212DRAFT_1313238 [Suillus subaureus]|uniref:Uncharacterized protein n=1 Tax=Suillus subaureus TaxID=48587 RepID=A0A9P7EPF9_9AGAM|nr:uncharacterized protein BJ212DRAFT_1313238 [Suillus subaureus]KAG1827587.1 hypothetical protein BJ212DRAFT_1313238 [Suillus subaureus]